jgi:hypothetical protein
LKNSVLEIIYSDLKHDVETLSKLAKNENHSRYSPIKSATSNRSGSKKKLSLTLAREEKTSAKKRETIITPTKDNSKHNLFYSATNKKLTGSNKSETPMNIFASNKKQRDWDEIISNASERVPNTVKSRRINLLMDLQ